jgi:hypothetical protein
MESNTGKTTKPTQILLLMKIEDPRVRYITAKKLVAMFPETPFSNWKTKLDEGESIILGRSENIAGLKATKLVFEAIDAPVKIIEQQSIGGKPVF